MARTTERKIVTRMGQRLTEERRRMGLTQEEAAVRADLSVSHLREVEEGYPYTDDHLLRGPTLVKLERIAQSYGMHVTLIRE